MTIRSIQCCQMMIPGRAMHSFRAISSTMMAGHSSQCKILVLLEVGLVKQCHRIEQAPAWITRTVLISTECDRSTTTGQVVAVQVSHHQSAPTPDQSAVLIQLPAAHRSRKSSRPLKEADWPTCTRVDPGGAAACRHGTTHGQDRPAARNAPTRHSARASPARRWRCWCHGKGTHGPRFPPG